MFFSHKYWMSPPECLWFRVEINISISQHKNRVDSGQFSHQIFYIVDYYESFKMAFSKILNFPLGLKIRSKFCNPILWREDLSGPDKTSQTRLPTDPEYSFSWLNSRWFTNQLFLVDLYFKYSICVIYNNLLCKQCMLSEGRNEYKVHGKFKYGKTVNLNIISFK